MILSGVWIRRLPRTLCLVLQFIVMALPVVAADSEANRNSLRGFNTFIVQAFVDEECNVEERLITAEMELALRQNSIGIGLSKPYALLGTAISCTRRDDGLVLYHVSTGVVQSATVINGTELSLETWGVEEFGAVGRTNLRRLREIVKDQLVRFLNAYLSVNPKK